MRDGQNTAPSAAKQPLDKLLAQAYIPAMIYFIQAGPDGPIKIGYTNREVKWRMVTLQGTHYEELRLRAAVRGDTSMEQEFHRMFKALRIRGEWFRYEEPLVSCVIKLESGMGKKQDQKTCILCGAEAS